MIEVMELTGETDVRFDILIKNGIIPPPQRRGYYSDGRWINRPLWNRATIEQAVFLQKFADAFKDVPHPNPQEDQSSASRNGLLEREAGEPAPG